MIWLSPGKKCLEKSSESMGKYYWGRSKVTVRKSVGRMISVDTFQLLLGKLPL